MQHPSRSLPWLSDSLLSDIINFPNSPNDQEITTLSMFGTMTYDRHTAQRQLLCSPNNQKSLPYSTNSYLVLRKSCFLRPPSFWTFASNSSLSMRVSRWSFRASGSWGYPQEQEDINIHISNMITILNREISIFYSVFETFFTKIISTLLNIIAPNQ